MHYGTPFAAARTAGTVNGNSFWAEAREKSYTDPKTAFFAELSAHNYPVYDGDGRIVHAGLNGRLPDKCPASLYTFCPGHETAGSHDPSLCLDLTAEGRVLAYCWPCQQSWYLAVIRGEIPECSAVYRVHEAERGSGGGSGRTGGRLISSLDITSDERYSDFAWQQTLFEEEGGWGEIAVYKYGEKFAKVRFGTRKGAKTFRWYRRTPGGWARRLAYEAPPLYGSDDLSRGGPVLCIEGEKDVQAAHRLGFDAVSVQCFEPGWRLRDRETLQPGEFHAVSRVDWSWMRGRDLVVIPDNDEEGLRQRDVFAGQVAQAGYEGLLRIMNPLPGVAPKGDLSDWEAAGGTRQELLDWIATVPESSFGKYEETGSEGNASSEGETLGEDERIVQDAMRDPQLSRLLVREQVLISFRRLRKEEELRARAGQDDESWEELDHALLLEGPGADGQPELLRTVEGAALLHRAKLHWLWGHSDAGKTTLMILYAAQLIAAGEQVVWLDMESQARENLRKLHGMMGLDEKTVRQFFHIAQPREDFSRKGYEKLLEYRPGLVVVDSSNSFVQSVLHGELNQDSSIVDMEDRVINPALAAGAAVAVIDHLAKAADQKGGKAAKGWPKNSGKKKNIAWTGTLLENKMEFSKGRDGYSALVFYKDHSGTFTDKHTAAYLVMEKGKPRLASNLPFAMMNATMKRTEAARSTRDDKAESAREERMACIVTELKNGPAETKADLARRVRESYGEKVGAEVTIKRVIDRLIAEGQVLLEGNQVRLP